MALALLVVYGTTADASKNIAAKISVPCSDATSVKAVFKTAKRNPVIGDNDVIESKIRELYDQSEFKELYEALPSGFTEEHELPEGFSESFQELAKEVYKHTGVLFSAHIYNTEAEGLNLRVQGSCLLPYHKIYVHNGSKEEEKSMAFFCAVNIYPLKSGKVVSLGVTPAHSHNGSAFITLTPNFEFKSKQVRLQEFSIAVDSSKLERDEVEMKSGLQESGELLEAKLEDHMVVWVAEANPGDERPLTKSEKQEILERICQHYKCKAPQEEHIGHITSKL